MKNRILAFILFYLLIISVIITAIIDLIYGGRIAEIYAIMSGISILISILPLWLANKIFKSTTLKDIVIQKQLIWGWVIFLFCIPTNYIMIYVNIFDACIPHNMEILV